MLRRDEGALARPGAPVGTLRGAWGSWHVLFRTESLRGAEAASPPAPTTTPHGRPLNKNPSVANGKWRNTSRDRAHRLGEPKARTL
jgi:hypothetical protein